MCLDWYPNPFPGIFAWLQELTSSVYTFSIAGSLGGVHSHKFLRLPIALGFYVSFSLVSFSTLLLHIPNLIPPVHIPNNPQLSCETILFPLPREIQPSLLEPSLLLSFSESMDYSMVILILQLISTYNGVHMMLIFLDLG